MKDKASNIIRQIALSLIVFFAGNSHVYAVPGSLYISQTPLFLGSGVQPNIFFVSDDSGSMDWETMMGNYWLYYSYDHDWNRAGDHANHNDQFFSSMYDGGVWIAAEFNNTVSIAAYAYIYGPSDGVGGTGAGTDNVYGDPGQGCNTSYYLEAEACGDSAVPVSPFDLDWRVRSSSLNKLFFNADIEYTPWSGPCGSSDCADADFNRVRNDPYSGQPGYDILRDLNTDGDAQGNAFVYEVWIDDSGYTGDKPKGGASLNPTGYAASNLSTGPAAAALVGNDWVDLWDSHVNIRVSNAQVDVKLIAYNPDWNNGNGGINEAVSFLNTSLTGGACYNILGNSAMVRKIQKDIITTPANAGIIASATGAVGCRTIAEVKQNTANWYQYYRRRAFPVKNAVAAVIDAQPTFHYGMTLLNENSTGTDDIFIPVPADGENVSLHNLNIKNEYFSYRQKAFGTPLRKAVQLAGQYYEGKKTALAPNSPIIASCQKNFTILFTDGYWNGDSPNIGDTDGDGISHTVADVAYYYYWNDLSLREDNVSIDGGEKDIEIGSTGKTHQHMVTFTVAFGVDGNLIDNDNDDVPDFKADGNDWSTPGVATKNGDGAAGWGTPVRNGGSVNIDDLWHAAFNTSGIFASASTPDEITETLINAISNIEKRQSSAAAVALNSGTLNANSRVYQAAFNSTKWSGSIISIPIQDGPIDVDGIPGDDSPSECDNYQTLGELCIDFSKNEDGEWNAEKELETRLYTDRNIFTFSPVQNKGVVFDDILNLDVAQQDALKVHPDSSAVETIDVAKLRMRFIRGDDSNEGAGSANFRKRKFVAIGSSKLGDIVHSAPAFVGKPSFFYPDKLEADSYNAFKEQYKNRKGIVYVGANDGMLHAFDASNGGSKGSEIFAYIPGKLISKLPQLTSKTYNQKHTFFVDGSPIVFDAYSGGWRTLLANSAGAGGQLVFGLDITDVSASNALSSGANYVKWEFTDEPRTVNGKLFGDNDLGYTIGDVSYARLNNGKWVVIFGNGFNSTEPDDNYSQTGNGVIYVVDAFTGELLRKLDTGAGMAEDPTGANRPNGISRVTPVDLNGDFKADALYAGDLFGNVWEVDIKSSNVDSWTFSKTLNNKPAPFYVAKDSNGAVQPITTAVVVKRHPDEANDTLVFFGTGSYFQLDDASSTQRQTFYAIWNDRANNLYARNDLLPQFIEGTKFNAGNEFRITTSADLLPAKYQIDWNKHKGWYIDLTETGERVNVEPILRGDRVIFVTMTPDKDPCNYGGSSWIMELRASNGSRLKQSPFDVDGDGFVDENDFLSFLGDAATITSGVRSKDGIVAKPGILNTKGTGSKQKELKFLSGTSGKIGTIDESVNSLQRARQSWRQLR